MKIVDFDKLSVLNLHYCQYTLDYFLDCMQELGIKNVELLGGHQGLWLDPNEYQDPEPVRKKLQEHGLKPPDVSHLQKIQMFFLSVLVLLHQIGTVYNGLIV